MIERLRTIVRRRALRETSGMQDAFAIGAWRFIPAEDELRQGDARRKLEHRAARTLELLCRHRGAIVSRAAILDAVWQGRAVSPNSVAIVVSDLREALGDPARSPVHIETVAKRGYRLRDEAAVAAPVRRRWPVAAAAAALLVLAAAIGWRVLAPAPVTLAVSEVADETGDARYAPLARASSAVLTAAATRETGATVRQAGAGADYVLRARLILWSGKPTLMMAATDAGGTVIWTAMSRGGEDVIPADVNAAMRALRGRLARR